jgi:hypothetical protein
MSPSRLDRRSLLGASGMGLVLSLAGCASPQIYHRQLAVLDKGQSPERAHALLEQGPLSIQEGRAGGRTLEFHRYLLNNGVQLDTYFLAFEQRRLVYWGFVSEFRRQPDADLAAALVQVLSRPAGPASAPG